MSFRFAISLFEKWWTLLTPCTHITRGDQCLAHHVCGQLGLRVLTQRRLKCTLYCITRSIELYMKTHSEIAHQYGAFKICLMMTSGEMGQYEKLKRFLFIIDTVIVN